MKEVQTVTGRVTTEELGSVLMHEHIFSSSMGIATHYPQMYRPDYMEKAVEDLHEMKACGFSTIVEATPVCLGRDVRALKKASELSGVNIIASTGWWGCEPPYLGPSTAEQWARCFIDDINVGCDGTDIKAGILKAAMDYDGATPWKVKMHHAVGMAQVETGKKIFLHTYCPTETPRKQLVALKEVGVDMNNVAVDHIPETTDLDFVKWIYDQGVWLGIDRIPIMRLPGDCGAVHAETRLKFVKTLLDEGMGDRMLFSHDFSSVSPLFDNQPEDVKEDVVRQNPYRFRYLKEYAFPKIADMGIDPDYLWSLTYKNPKAFFEG